MTVSRGIRPGESLVHYDSECAVTSDRFGQYTFYRRPEWDTETELAYGMPDSSKDFALYLKH